jgi:hypothetical protein
VTLVGSARRHPSAVLLVALSLLDAFHPSREAVPYSAILHAAFYYPIP